MKSIWYRLKLTSKGVGEKGAGEKEAGGGGGEVPGTVAVD